MDEPLSWSRGWLEVMSDNTEREASLAALDRGLDQLADLVSAVGPDDLDRPTPCTDWRVADLVNHIVFSVAGSATSARGGEVDWSDPTPDHDDPVADFAAAADDLRAAMREQGGDSTADWQLAEIATHTYDLATGLGRPTSGLDPVVAERGLAFMSAALTPDRRAPVFGPEQPAPEGADAYQRIAAFAGRTVA